MIIFSGMATDPMQEWSQLYDWDTALRIGTIFPCLNLEFYRAENTVTPSCCGSKSAGQEAATLFRELLAKRLELLEDYATKYNPLTQLSIVTGTPDSTVYGWAEGPLPWEGGHI